MNKLYQSYDVAAGYQYQTMHVAHIHRVLTLKRGTDNLGHDSGLSFFPEEIKALNYSTYLQILSLIFHLLISLFASFGMRKTLQESDIYQHATR